MAASPIPENDFIRELTSVVGKNIANEQFGVSELADAMNMSRSNLLRKVKKETNLSVSQFISQVRLNRAMEMLRTTSFNVSEVSHQVGFNSTSYFIKCFREYYGYPPGEVGKRDAAESDPAGDETGNIGDLKVAGKSARRRRWIVPVSLGGVVLAVIMLIAYYSSPSGGSDEGEKSIAVLPFKNESNDSSNVYLINGLMEATLNNLQQIKDLRVISRTTAEKYRNSSKSIPEMAKELNVKYFVEGSGQKIGDRILLNIQLIDASSDKHLWARQYRRESKDIFELQQEIARNIAEEIQVIITPEEEKRIGKKPTDDIVAYDYFLKGKDLFYKSGSEDLRAAIPWFNKAIQQDPEFALAYANAAMVYYYLDIFQFEKKYGNEVSSYADKAMLYDPRSGESLVAKALVYAQKKEYEHAVLYFEKALEYNPSSGLVLHFLTEFYSLHVPNPRKYLEYALLKVKVDNTSLDSVTTGFNYFHLSNAYMQSGFVDEAITYINKSLSYDPNGYFARYVKAYILYGKDKNPRRAKELLVQEFEKDTNRFDIIQEIGKLSFMMRDYEEAYRYYKRFNVLREMYHLDIYNAEDLKIGLVYAKMGRKQEGEAFIKRYKDFADNDRSMYKDLFLTTYYANTGNEQKALQHMRLFSKQDNYVYWVLFLADDPEVDAIKDDPEFKEIMHDIESKFWKTHKEIRESLEVGEEL
jgi:TolB-like protein/AraC-like DNA-binding protein/Tfp pilus assembly protein PilF